MKKTAAVLVLVSVILLAGCLGDSQPDAGEVPDNGDNQQVSCSDVEGETHTVAYSSSGFSPSEITIQRCDTVRWESEGAEMWVASDVHPPHTGYDGTNVDQHCPGSNAFDQCEAGSTYSFTFEKAGEWSYHNHVLAAHGGTVTVQAR
jgi:plastocyanin